MDTPADRAAPGSSTSTGPNAIARGLGILGDEWSLQLLRAAHLGATRFGRFQEQLPISTASLAARLAFLSDAGLFTRRIYQENPIRAEYVLTPSGRATWPILLAIWDWERTWVADGREDLPRMRHRSCGQEFQPRLVCATCQSPATHQDVRATWGASGEWARSVPDTGTRRRPRPARSPEQFPETMTVFGNRWSAVVIGAVFQGMCRFSQFESTLNIGSTMLSERLRLLVDREFLRTRRSAAGRTEYRLTKKGTAFFPVVALALQWSDRWLPDPDGPAMLWRHDDHPFVARLDCGACGTALLAPAVEVVAPTHPEPLP